MSIIKFKEKSLVDNSIVHHNFYESEVKNSSLNTTNKKFNETKDKFKQSNEIADIPEYDDSRL